MNKLMALMMGALLAATPALAQDVGEPLPLSLEEAIGMARENNPTYRSQLNDAAVADWGVRSAYANFLPTASVNGGVMFQEGGQIRIGSFTAGDIGLSSTPDYYYSSYGVNVSLGLSGADYFEVGRQKAQRRSVLAQLDEAAQTLEANVTRQYLSVLLARDAVDLAEAELERAEANLALAEARYEAEAVTVIEVKQAQVERGRAEVGLIRTRSDLSNQKVRLLELVGTEVDRPVTLTTEVTVFEPQWSLPSLLEAAVATQPSLKAARASTESAKAGVGVARSSFWPTLSFSTGLSGFTRRAGSDDFLIRQAQQQVDQARESCEATNELLSRLSPPLPPQDCSDIIFTEADRAAIVEQNNQFPFDFTTEPVSMSFGVSLPIFQGLNRKRQLETAVAQAEDAEWQLRARELKLRADVETAYRELRTAYEAARLEERNLELARDQLRLARERYRVGSAAFIELMEAEALMARADREYLSAVYTFQQSLTALEEAVGQKLATPES
jgi:outer membrane protein